MPKKILIVEDRRDFRLVLTAMLREARYDVAAAADGKEGLRLFREKNPDLVLLDYNLPDTNGHEVCRQIRADPGNGKVPVIFITVQSDPEDVVRGLKAGGDYYITKPFNPDEVLRRVAAILRRAESAGVHGDDRAA